MKRRVTRKTRLFLITMFVCLGALSVRPAPCLEETKTFVAYSMKVAQARVEAAVKAGEDSRKKEPDLYYLGGITKPWAVVIDAKSNDWILLGERDPKCSVLTLDDWTTAIRARFTHPEEDPGVTIDPHSCEECLAAGKPHSCTHSKDQDVRYFAGVANTHFGRVCYEADWLMKRISFGVAKTSGGSVPSYFDLMVDRQGRSAASRKQMSRLWFYPLASRVNVSKEAVLLERFEMGVFTELLYLEVGGKPVADLRDREDAPAEVFSRSLSDNYDEVAQTYEVLETLRGLARLAGLAKGLVETPISSQVAGYLSACPPEQAETPTKANVLSVLDREAGIELSGGVEMAAQVARLSEGSTSALREIVLEARPSGEPLTWDILMEVENGRLTGIIPVSAVLGANDTALALCYVLFLFQKNRTDAVIESASRVLAADPRCTEARILRGYSYGQQEKYDKALEDLNQALESGTCSAFAHLARAGVYAMKDDYERMIADCDAAISSNQRFAPAYVVRAVARLAKSDFDKALADLDAGIKLDPGMPLAYIAKGQVYLKKDDYEKAIGEFTQSIRVEPSATAYTARAACHLMRGEGGLAREDMEMARGFPELPDEEGMMVRFASEALPLLDAVGLLFEPREVDITPPR